VPPSPDAKAKYNYIPHPQTTKAFSETRRDKRLKKPSRKSEIEGNWKQHKQRTQVKKNTMSLSPTSKCTELATPPPNHQ
jgi:hypothetical protein